MKYSELIGVGKHFKSAFDVMSDRGETWKTFISNERFERNLSQIMTSLTSPTLAKRKSIWIQGTYGTGKSHSLAVIKHLLSDDYEDIADYIPNLKHSQLRSSVTSFRKSKKVFPVVLKGVYSITDVADLAYTIQHEVAKALGSIQISTKTDFDSLLQILKNESLDSFFEDRIENNPDLYSYVSNKGQLITALENHETAVLRLVADELKQAGLGGFRAHNIVDWLAEVRQELKAQGIADYLLLIWDEFTSLLEIPARRSILNVIQDIAELSCSEAEDDPSDTLGVHLLLVTHKRLEATETYKELKEDERNMAQARFTELDYGMQPTTTFHILSGALDRRQPALLQELIQKNLLDTPSVRMIVDQIVDSDAVNAAEVKETVIGLYPFHPYTSYLATFVSRVIGEAERSIFEFLNDDKKGFIKFIETDVDRKKFLTADYVWDFFCETFEKNTGGNFGIVTNRFKLSGETVAAQGEDCLAVFKTILLLNILYRVATTDGDASEKSMVNPSTKNIVAAFSGEMEESRVLAILDHLDEKQILHRNPDNIFEISSSALPPKKILETKTSLYPGKEDVSKIVEEYSIKCVGELRKALSMGVSRELDAQVFWGGEKEYLLRDKILAKFKTDYTINVAVMLYRGETKALDELLGRREITQIASKDMLLSMSKEDEFKNTVFVLANTELGNRRFEAYLDSLAQESVARTLQMNDERIEGAQNAEKWVVQWIEEIKNSGMADVLFRGDAVHIPFDQCSKHLKSTFIPAIFRYGLDALPSTGPEWIHQTSGKAVELALYSASKSDLERDAHGNDKAVCRLLSNGSELLFNDQLELVSGDDRVPVVKLCREVNRVFEQNKNESSINLAEEFRFFTKPEYGYYRNRLFMGALALAMRPYVDRLYTSGSGQRIDKILMRDIIVSIFVYWEDPKRFKDNFMVRMSTEEERTLTNRLNVIFGIANQEGLLSTKWAIRMKFQEQSQSPLWALKYVGEHQDAYKDFIDKMFKFSKSTDESIQQSFILELLEGVKLFDIELTSDLAVVEDVRCLDNYILRELEAIKEPADSLERVKAYLDDHLSGEIAFWEEDDVHEKILMWKIHKEERKKSPWDTAAGGTAPAPSASDPRDTAAENLQERVKRKIEQNRADSAKLYQILMLLVDKYSDIWEDIEHSL